MDALDPTRTAVLLMDFQPGIVSRYPAADALQHALEVRDAARAAGATVGYVHVALTPEEAEAVPTTNRTFSAFRERLAGADPADSEVDPRVGVVEGEIVVRKIRVGAFSTTDLDAQLRSRGVDTLVLSGIATSGVVLSTVRAGADKDYRIVVVADACADLDDEVHRVLVEKVFPRQAEVVTASEAVAALGAAAA